jgi:hypothetical protein
MTRNLRSLIVREDGIAMVLVVIISAFMTLLAVTLIDVVRAESDRGAHANWSGTSFQAAEAGLDDYISKLVDDHGFYLHYVHPAESTRSPSTGITAPHPSDCVAPTYGPKTSTGVAWGYSKTWTYPNGKDNWCQLPNGFYYNLQIYPPGTAGNPTTSVRMVATGRRSMTSTDDMRAVESYIRPSNLADFYRFSDDDVSIDAETFGKIYSNGNVNHTGTAHADIFAEGSITGSPTMVDGAQTYANGAFPTSKIKNHPIDFSKFLVSLVDIKRAAQSGGVYLNQSGKTGWRIVFNADGTFTAAPCTGANLELSPAPVCTPAATYNVPSNGAIYTDVTAIVSGPVNGRVTVGAGQNIVVADAINPVTGGQDVIGLVAYSDLWVAEYAPAQLTWSAAVLVETNTWHSAGSGHGGGSHMTFTGSAATATGGSFTDYSTRTYGYDQNLQYLSPPWFPAIDDTYTITLFREVTP